MKNYKIYTLLIVILFFSCGNNKKERLFSEIYKQNIETIKVLKKINNEIMNNDNADIYYSTIGKIKSDENDELEKKLHFYNSKVDSIINKIDNIEMNNAQEVKNLINMYENYKNFILHDEFIYNKSIKFLDNINLNKLLNINNQSFQEFEIYLSELKMNIILYNISVLSCVLGHFYVDLPYNQIEAIVLPEQYELSKGDIYTAKIFICGLDTWNFKDYFINDKKLEMDNGIAKFKGLYTGNKDTIIYNGYVSVFSNYKLPFELEFIRE